MTSASPYTPQGRRTVAALVRGRGHLRAARAGLRRLRRRRHRRLPRPDPAARLPGGPRRHRDLAPAVLPLSASRRRVRHRLLPRGAPRLRDDARLPDVPARGPRPRAARHHRARAEPHLRHARVVPAGPARQAGQPGPRLLRVERHARPVPRRAHHLQRLRELQLVVGPDGGGLLLAPLLLPPARPELGQPRGAAGDVRGRRLLARDGRRRAAPRRRALPVRAGGDELREPARDPRGPEAAAPPRRPSAPRPDAARRGEPVARGRRRLLRRRRRVQHGLPLPAHAAHVHGRADGGPLSAHRHPGPDPGDPGGLPVGDLPAKPRRADPRDGHRRGARLHVPHLRGRPPGPHQPGHPPPARAAARQRPPRDRAGERAPALAARDARHLLRRRARHGRQHLPGRPKRRPHADAVERRPQRRLLAGQPAAALPAGRSATPSTAPSTSRPSRRTPTRCSGG